MAGKVSVGWARRIDRTQPRSADPHRNLMAAVLRAVVDDMCDAAARKNALAYVMSTDRQWPFSFENLCEALGMDADGVRCAVGREPGWKQCSPRVVEASMASASGGSPL